MNSDELHIPIEDAVVELIGQQVGPYTIIELLGKGGMATVYRAYQASVNRDVAIKVLKPALADRADFAGQLEREAQLVASLKHPYIVKILDFGQHESLVYIVMELYNGGSLAKANNEGPLPLESI